jgi:glycosyltransferase 2 family protein
VPLRRALLWAVALASTVGFGYLAIRDAHPDEVWDALQRANIWWVVPSFAVLVVAVAVRALRWQLLFHRDTRPSYGATAAAALVGLAVNSILPLRAGEAARVIALNRRARTSPVESVATVALERILDVLCLLLLLLAALPWLPEVDWVGAAAAVALALTAVLVGAALLFAVYGERPFHALDRLLRRLPFGHHEWVEQVGASLRRGLVALRDPTLALTAFALTVVSWVLTSVSFWLLTLGFDLDLPVVSGVLILAAVGFSVILPAGPGSLGVFEAATVVALAAYDISASEALSYAFTLHAVNLIPYVVAGAFAVRFTRPPR